MKLLSDIELEVKDVSVFEKDWIFSARKPFIPFPASPCGIKLHVSVMKRMKTERKRKPLIPFPASPWFRGGLVFKACITQL